RWPPPVGARRACPPRGWAARARRTPPPPPCRRRPPGRDARGPRPGRRRRAAPRGAASRARAAARAPAAPGPRAARRCSFEFRAPPALVPAHRRPEPVLLQPGDVVLRLLARSARDDGLALDVHLHHQPLRLLLREAEQLLEHVRDVG